MPKLITPAMRAHLDEETTRLAAIWRITRKDGAQFFFTDHYRDIVFGGDTYRADAGFERTAIRSDAGLTAADLDVTELTDEVHGFGIARQISVRGALEMLAAAYAFDAVESDHQLKFKKRGRSPSRVIAEQDLVPVNAEREAFIETRAQEVDLPLRFTVVYQDLERDADIGTQYAKRVAGPSSAMHSRNEATFDLPLMLTAAEAKGIALRQLHSAWLERTGYEWRLPWTHVDLEPADVVQVALDDGTLLNVRILETELGANLELAWKTVLEESSSYTVTAVPGGGLNYLPQVDPVSSEARLFLLDVPLIRDSDDAVRAATGHYWAAAAYFDPPWRGAVLFSSDDGAVYVAADETLDAVAWGVARTALPDTDLPFQTDLTSQLHLTMVSGSLASVSNLEMLTTSFTYTSGMQSADFGGAQTELSFVVYQISAQVGRGFPSDRTGRGPAVSNNLELAQVAAAQSEKMGTFDDEAGQLDAGVTNKVDVALTGTTSPLVLSDAQALRCMVIELDRHASRRGL